MLFSLPKIDEQCLESLLDVFSIVPGLELANKNDQPATESSQIELYALSQDYLTANSNVTDQSVHRKMFNDAFVNFLSNKVLQNHHFF